MNNVVYLLIINPHFVFPLCILDELRMLAGITKMRDKEKRFNHFAAEYVSTYVVAI